MTATVSYPTQGNKLWMMNKTVSPAVAVVIAQLQGLDGLSGQGTSIDVSNLDSGAYMEYEKGMIDPGKPSGTVVYNFGDAGHQLLQKALGLVSGATTDFFYGMSDNTTVPTVVAGVLTPPKTGSSPSFTWSRSGFQFSGFVIEFSKQSQKNNVMIGKLTIQATGAQNMVVKGSAATYIN